MSQLHKVLFTESSPNIGGQELQLLAQAEGLAKDGIETLIACKPNSRIADHARERGIETVLLPFRNSFHPPSIFALRKVLDRFRPDAIIAHSGHDANTVALAARLLRKRPLLIRARTYQPGKPHAWTYNTLFDLTLVPSRYLAGLLLRNAKIDPARIQVLYPGIDFEHAHVDATNSAPPLLQQLVDNRRRILLHAAMLREEKGHRLILSTLPELVSKFPDLCYVIAGEGGLSEALKEEVRARQLETHVVFAGMVKALLPFMQRAELVIMPSSYEPLGMSQIEALGEAVPVVVSRTGGIPETVEDGHTGLLADPTSSVDWQDKLAWALEHPEQMRAMAREGQTKVRAQFSMANNLHQLQQHLIAGLSKRG